MKTKQIISTLLVLSLILAVLPMSLGAQAADPAPAQTVNATYYKWGGWNYPVDIIGQSDDIKRFDSTIDQLMDNTGLDDSFTRENVTSFCTSENPDAYWNEDNYLIRWTGTVTAEHAGDYTFLGKELDNGLMIKVNGEKVFEFWGISHWYLGQEQPFDAGLGSFHLDAGETAEIEVWFLELEGGQLIEMAVSQDGGATHKSFADAGLTFDLKQELYHHRFFLQFPGDGGALQYSKAAPFIRDCFYPMGSAVISGVNGGSPLENVANIDTGKLDDYFVDFDGWLSVKKSGTYYFGTTLMDNGFYFEIDGQRVFEFFVDNAFSDQLNIFQVDGQYQGIELEAGKSYPFKASFMEQGGGEAVNIVCKIDDTGDNATVYDIEDVVTFSATAGTTQQTVNASYRRWGGGNVPVDICGENDDTQRFDSTIDTLMDYNALDTGKTRENVTSFVTSENPDAYWNEDNYLIHWTGTVTAERAGDYTFLGKELDNGLMIKVNGEKVFEFWGISHWYLDQEQPLDTGLGSFHLDAGETAEIEVWFLELVGGQIIEMAVSQDGGATSKSFADAGLTFNLKQEVYHNKFWTKFPGDGGAFQYDQSIDFIRDAYALMGNAVITGVNGGSPLENVRNIFTNQMDDYFVEFSGWLSVKKSGTYYFGTTLMDNGFCFEIDGQRVFEFFVDNAFSDQLNLYKPDGQYKGIYLEAGKVYPFNASFLEQLGGEGLNIVCMINDTGDNAAVYDLEDVVTFSATHEHKYENGLCACGAEDPNPPATEPATQEPPVTKPAETGDTVIALSMLGVVALAGGAVASSRSRKIDGE